MKRNMVEMQKRSVTKVSLKLDLELFFAFTDNQYAKMTAAEHGKDEAVDEDLGEIRGGHASWKIKKDGRGMNLGMSAD